METESNFETRRVNMMKESITRTQKVRSESTPVDLERRASCSSLIGGYEGFKNLKNQGGKSSQNVSNQNEYNLKHKMHDSLVDFSTT